MKETWLPFWTIVNQVIKSFGWGWSSNYQNLDPSRRPYYIASGYPWVHILLLQPSVVGRLESMMISTAMDVSWLCCLCVSTVTWTTTSWQQLTGLPLRLLSILFTCKLHICCAIILHHICIAVIMYHNYLLCVCMAAWRHILPYLATWPRFVMLCVYLGMCVANWSLTKQLYHFSSPAIDLYYLQYLITYSCKYGDLVRV